MHGYGRGRSGRIADVHAKKGGATPDINVTPLVDVVLVLLIIFMVVTPLLEREMPLKMPQIEEKPATEPPPPDEDNVVLVITKDAQVKINSEVVTLEDLAARLEPIVKRKDRVLFFAAEDDAPYGLAMDALDRARGAGAKTIAYLNEIPAEAPDEEEAPPESPPPAPPPAPKKRK